jgi:aspartyl-tRNA(Asn)/glutamyl-tRNA(Gln) amidotransferase subunit B
MGELARALNAAGLEINASPVTPEALAALVGLIDKGTISGAIAKTVFEKMFATGRSAADIVAAEGLTQIDDDGAIEAAVADAIAGNQDAVAQYRGGKGGALGFLVGQVMKATKGKANPKRVNELLRKALGA